MFVCRADVAGVKQLAIKLLSKDNDRVVHHKLFMFNTDDVFGTQLLEDFSVGLAGARGYEHKLDLGYLFFLVAEQLFQLVLAEQVTLAELGLEDKKVAFIFPTNVLPA